MANQQETLTLIQDAFNYLNKGKDDGARRLYRQIGEIAPDDYENLFHYGNLSLKLGEAITAIKVFSELTASDPQSALYQSGLGTAYLLNRQILEGIYVLNKAMELDATAPGLLDNLGTAYMDVGDFDSAIEILQKALHQKPSSVFTNINLATCLLASGRHNEALVLAKIATKRGAKDPRAHCSLGRVYMEIGQHDIAISCFQRAIMLDETYGYAYSSLAECKKASDEDTPLIAKAEKVLKKSMPAAMRAYIHFYLGKMYNDLKQWDIAFEHYKQGNLLNRDVQMPEFSARLFNESKKVFSRGLLSGMLPRGLETDLPVFIVGMPRSGSTLIEQIISRHPQAYGAGELNELRTIAERIAPNGLEHFVSDWQKILNDEAALRQHAETYIRRLRKLGESASRIVDKQLLNYRYLGMMQLFFPNATIIHSVRDPLDTCLSCFFQPFRDVRWTNDLAWIGKWYCHYREIMDYWNTVLPPGKVISIHYEELVKDPETQMRRIIDACRLEWDPICMEFYATDNTVSTASQWQVRQPIYSSSTKRWHSYAPYLGELANEIQRYLTEEDIAFLETSGAKIKKRRWFAWF